MVELLVHAPNRFIKSAIWEAFQRADFARLKDCNAAIAACRVRDMNDYRLPSSSHPEYHVSSPPMVAFMWTAVSGL